jgi:ABC-2 type transport system permease protein
MSVLARFSSEGLAGSHADTVGGPSRYVNLTRELALTNFKLKYTGSVLGYLWSLMKPLMYFGILYVIFVEFFHQKQSNFPLQLLVAIVIFTFFSECTSTALGSIAGNGHLVRKAYFPLSALVVSQSVTALLTMAINFSLIVLIAAPFGKLHLGPRTLVLPLLLLELYVLSLGVGMLLASAFVFYRDLGHVWEVFTQLLLYGCGVVFPALSVPAHWRSLFFLNPLAQIIEDARHAVVTPDAPWTASLLGGPAILVPFVVSGVVFLAGLWLFRALNPLFAESL